MKLDRIPKQKAEQMIVYGEDKGFSMIKLGGEYYTIYHRVYENTFYDILQMETLSSNEQECVTTFYILDIQEVDMLLHRNKADTGGVI